MPREAGDTRCPTCGGSAHALDATTAEKFGGREFIPQGARKHLDRAWDEGHRMARELDATYAHLRALVGYQGDRDGLRHAIAGLLPETRELTPEQRATFASLGPGMVERLDAGRAQAWRDLGFPPISDDKSANPEGWRTMTITTTTANIEAEFRNVLIQLELLSMGACQSWNKSSPPAEIDRAPHGLLETPPHIHFRWRWTIQRDGASGDAGRADVLRDAQDELDAWRVCVREPFEFDWPAEVLSIVGPSPKEVSARCNGIVTERQVMRWRTAAGKDPSNGETPTPEEPTYLKALRMDADGIPVRAIAMNTGVPKSTIHDWLRAARKAKQLAA